MDNDHLINTIRMLDRKFAEGEKKKIKYALRLKASFKLMLRETKKRGLMPRLWRERGDVREMVKATKELHSKPDFIGRINHAETHGTSTDAGLPHQVRQR
jgi:hypothetical protein